MSGSHAGTPGGPAVRTLLERRRNRAIKAILSTKEAACDAFLPGDASDQLRRVVLEELNDFFEVAATVLGEMEARVADGVVYNELWLDKIDQIHEAMVANAVPEAGMRQSSVRS